jgi:hypothetical protein
MCRRCSGGRRMADLALHAALQDTSRHGSVSLNCGHKSEHTWLHWGSLQHAESDGRV